MRSLEHSLPEGKLIVGGFSQGGAQTAMLEQYRGTYRRAHTIGYDDCATRIPSKNPQIDSSEALGVDAW